MDNFPQPDCLVLPSELPSSVYGRLILLLSNNNSWENVAEYLQDYEVLTEEEVLRLKRSEQPAERLLQELGCRLCNVENLCCLLDKCQLYNALLLFKPHEQITIVEHPFGSGDDNSAMVIRGRTLRLTCRATGFPPPTYQWYVDNDEVPNAAGQTLVIHNFEEENEGDYYCMVSQEDYGSVCSDVVAVTLAPEAPIITMQPRSQLVCRLGSSLVISARAQGHPQISYQWYLECKQLDGFTEPDLPIDIVTENEEGHYRCYIRNSAGEAWSQPCRVTVYVSPEDVSEQRPRPVASAKVALLIGNQEYDNMCDLHTPEEDVRTLAEILAKHDFQVIALQNLTLVEMQNAVKELCNILPKDAYVVFYFAGHGFDMKDKYMLPVSAPGPDAYLRTDALSEGELLRDLLDTQPQVLLELLDMCLKSPEHENKGIFEEIPQQHVYRPNNNLIQGYSTSSHLGAYERETDKNGIYVKFLKKYLTQDISMDTMLIKVAKDMEKEKQIPYRGTNVTKDYRLTDPSAPCEKVTQFIEALNRLPDIQQFNLGTSNVESLVTCSPHLGVYCNALQATFTNLQNYTVACETDDPYLILKKMERQGKDKVLTIKNLQKMRQNRSLTLELKNQSGTYYTKWELGLPMIAGFNLWRPRSQSFETGLEDDSNANNPS